MITNDSHHRAMEYADKADQARRDGNFEQAKSLYLKSFTLESNAALELQNHTDIEPTRSVLFRSAASLAIECEKLCEAERMIALGLSGFPPNEIAEELRDLLDRVTFERHMRLKGIKLDPNELQLSLWGAAIAPGIAQSREFRERIEKIETLSFRTLERKLERPFREAGRPVKEVSEIFDVYISVPRAASFAVTIRLAGNQQYLPGLDLGEDVVLEILDCLDLLNRRLDEDLQKRINNKDYYENFVSIAKQIAPDGKRISHVGLVLQRGDKERKLNFERKSTDWISPKKKDEESDKEKVEIKGALRFADATKKHTGIIELIDDKNARHKIKVPLGMMADIVRPLFDYDVIVKGIRDRKRTVLLEDIIKAEDEQ
ncbi:MAG TPA: hypothetical protein VMW67_01380 [Desulfobacteria bacterium]|nr:hypothetical protein [Desulfobacteria bacterium]